MGPVASNANLPTAMNSATVITVLSVLLIALPACAEGDSFDPTSLPPPSPEPQRTLQGGVERNDILDDHPLRIRRPLSGLLNQPQLKGNVNTSDFPAPPAVRMRALFPTAGTGKPLTGKAKGGEEESSVNWDAWKHRIVDAVWDPLQGMPIYGQTRVDYDVTRDHRIRITNIYTPDPSGFSGMMLAKSIMQLDGNAILEFPVGSQRTVHHNWNSAVGPPVLSVTSRKLYLPGGTERILKQW